MFDHVSKPVTLVIFLCLSFVNYFNEFEKSISNITCTVNEPLFELVFKKHSTEKAEKCLTYAQSDDLPTAGGVVTVESETIWKERAVGIASRGEKPPYCCQLWGLNPQLPG